MKNSKKLIHIHNHRGHVLDEPIISDAEFDKLPDELSRIEAIYPEWSISQVTRIVKEGETCIRAENWSLIALGMPAVTVPSIARLLIRLAKVF